MARKKRAPPRCQYGVSWHNELTGETGWLQCGGPGITPSQMCSEAGKHPPPPEKVDEVTGWPVLCRGWTIESVERWDGLS